MPGYYLNPPVTKRTVKSKINGKAHVIMMTGRLAKTKKIALKRVKTHANGAVSLIKFEPDGKEQSKGTGTLSKSTVKSVMPTQSGLMAIQVVDIYQIKDQIGHLLSVDGKLQVNTALIFTAEPGLFLSSQTETLKTIAESFLVANIKSGHVHFSFFITYNDQVHDLLLHKDVTRKALDLYSRREIFSVEHILDLVQLGQLTSSFNEAHWKGQRPFYVAHFSWKAANTSADQSKHFFIVEGGLQQQEQTTEAALATIEAIETCVRARQRKWAIPVERNALVHILRPAFTCEQSKMTVLHRLPQEPNMSAQTAQHLLDCFQRMQVYGTEEDDYGDNIIQMNQELIENIQPLDETKVYLYLLNNVSILEKDLLDAHKHFNEIMSTWSANHQDLQVMSSSNQMYDVEQYTSQLRGILVEQKKQIDNLIESMDRFKTGLTQLTQSVKDIEDDGKGDK